VFVILLFSLLTVCVNIFAQTEDSVKSFSLSEITITANKFENRIEELSTRIEVIDEKKIFNLNGNRLNDKLLLSPSVFIKSYGLSSSIQTISINGLGAEHTLILIDGIKMNSFQNSMIDLAAIPLDNIERIEIINNGLSSIYGSDALGGVVNLISRNPKLPNKDNNLSFKGSLTYGSFNTFVNNLSLTGKIYNFSTEINFSRQISDGSFEYCFDNGINIIKKQRERAAYKLTDFSISSHLLVDSSSRLKLLSTYSKYFREIPGLETGTPPSESSQNDKNFNNILFYEKIFTNNSILKLSFNYQNNLMKYELKPFVNSHYKNLVYAFTSDYEFIFHKTKNLLGYNFINASLKSNELETFANRNQHSFYFSSSIPLFDKITFYTSGRAEYLSDLKKNVFTYQTGMNLKPFNDYELRIKANLGKNFRAPTFNDLYWKESGNRELKPEISLNKELGLMYVLEFYYKIIFELSYINISAKDKIVWLPQRNFFWKPVNITSSESDSYLATLSLLSNHKSNLNFRYDLSFNYVESKKTNSNYLNDPTEGKLFPFIPIKSIKQTISIDFGIVGFNLFHIHYGKRFSDFENKKNLKPINFLDGNIILSLNLFDIYNSLKFEINNITNTDYQIISGYPMPLRNYKLTLFINI